jgi:hypothetical protein
MTQMRLPEIIPKDESHQVKAGDNAPVISWLVFLTEERTLPLGGVFRDSNACLQSAGMGIRSQGGFAHLLSGSNQVHQLAAMVEEPSQKLHETGVLTIGIHFLEPEQGQTGHM